MNDNQFKEIMKELDTIKRLLILNASKAGSDSTAIGKCIGLSPSHIRGILSGHK